MKFFNKNMILWTGLALLAITIYQSYWLFGLYDTMKAKLETDIQEAIRAADFEEMVTRINILRESEDNEIKQMNIMVGADRHDNKAYMLSETEKIEDTVKTIQTQLPNDNLSDILRSPEDVMEVGLYFQRGIHVGLDKEIDINVNYFDSLLTVRLDSLGVRVPHTTLFLKNNIDKYPDTLAIIGDIDKSYTKTFTLDLDINNNTQYQILLPKTRSIVFMQMNGILSVSFLTLVILFITFWNLIKTIKKQHALDEIGCEITPSKTLSTTEGKLIQIGRYEFYPITQTLIFNGVKTELSHRASEILRMLSENANELVDTDQILFELWGDNNVYNAGSLQVFITKLRHALSQDESIKIINVRGKGYKIITNHI